MSDAAANLDLSFVPTPDLFEELARRSHDCVFVGTLKCDDVDGGNVPTLQYKGSYHAALGLLVEGRSMLRQLKRPLRAEEGHE
jgi:hypothetical protein